MKNINLKTFSRLVSKKLGKKIQFKKIEKIGGGYHSDGFKLTATNGKEYFLKYVRSNDLGFEFPERHLMSIMVSNSMKHRASKDVRPVGVIVTNGEHELILPEINHSTKVFHLQEFAGTGESYASIIERNMHKKKVDDEDRQHLEVIAGKLAEIHSVKHPTKDDSHRAALYNDGVRNVLSNPELSLMVLSEFPIDHKILDLKGQKEIIGLMYENIRAMMGRHDRLSALHGDFWGANIFFKEDGSIFVIDYSRIPWGDPGIDVGWFLSLFLWNYHETGNRYFRDMAELWLDIYEKKSGDKEIRKFIPLAIGWTGIVHLYPRWFANVDVKMGKRYISHIKKILKNKKLVW